MGRRSGHISLPADDCELTHCACAGCLQWRGKWLRWIIVPTPDAYVYSVLDETRFMKQKWNETRCRLL